MTDVGSVGDSGATAKQPEKAQPGHTQWLHAFATVFGWIFLVGALALAMDDVAKGRRNVVEVIPRTAGQFFVGGLLLLVGRPASATSRTVARVAAVGGLVVFLQYMVLLIVGTTWGR